MTKDVFSFIPVSFDALEISLSSMFNVVLIMYPFNMPILYVLLCTIKAYISNYILIFTEITSPLSCGPKARLFQRIVPERESACEGTFFIRSDQRGRSRRVQRFGNDLRYLLAGGRGFGLGAGFCLGVENARKCRRIPPVRCTLCWA